jgi:uncharacterized protein
VRVHSHCLIGSALALCLATAASAGPYEDGLAALDKKDYATASRAFGEAAATGNAHAQAYLGLQYKAGLGVPADIHQAVQWLALAADAGDAMGQTMLGELYADGNGVTRDYNTALRYFTLASKQNYAPAQYRIGRLYDSGAGTVVAQDRAKAAQWYALAARSGDADAQFSLGYMYFYGAGLAKNFESAVALLRLGAQQDQLGAIALLGFAYDNGYGVPQDYAVAVRLYKHAAQRGSTNALGLLGEKYSSGQGTAQDWAKAYLLLSLAASRTEGATQQAMAKERDTAQSHLSADQIAKAQATAGECTSSDYARCPIDDNAPPPQMAKDGHAMTLYATGSGFYVTKAGHLVTNNHVVRECTEVHAGGRNLKIVNVDEKADLALLLDARKPASFARLRGAKDRLGEAVMAVGFPLHGLLGKDLIVTTGVVSSLSGLGGNDKNIQISAPIQPGNSGGPVLGEDGAVVGVVVSQFDAVSYASAMGEIPQNVNFAVSLGALQALLKNNKVAYAATDNGPRKSTADISAAASGYTVSLECWK